MVAGDVAYIDKPGEPRRLSDFLLARFNPDGSLDTTFGTDGLVFTDFDGSLDDPSDMVIQDDGNLVVAGGTFKLARYLVGSTSTGVSDEPLPERTPMLAEPFPNPFRVQASIQFTLPESVQGRLALYDVLGRKVAVLKEGMLAAGQHEVVLEAGTLAPGAYLLRLEAGGMIQTQVLTLVQ